MLSPPISCRKMRAGLLFAVVSLMAHNCFGQAAVRPDRGVKLNGAYSASDIENISLLNGNVNLSIPLAALPPMAGGKLSWVVQAQYNSKIWNMLRSQANDDELTWAPYTVSSPSADGGWRIGSMYTMIFRNANEDFQRLWYPGNSGLPQWELNLLNDFQWWKVVLRMPDGSEHEFRPTDQSPYSGSRDFLRGFYNEIPNGTPMRYYSVDGTYMFARITNSSDWTVYMPDGTQITQSPGGVERIQDPNGNKIKIFSDVNGTHYQDELTGREIRVTFNPSANNGLGQYQVWYNTVNGLPQHIDINLGVTHVRGILYPINMNGCELTDQLLADLPVVREIVFPQTEPGQPQRKFTFSYNSDVVTSETDPATFSCPGGGQDYTRDTSHGLGELSQMITPSGSVVDYSYLHDNVHSFSAFGIGDYIPQQAITQKKITHDGTFDIWTYSIGDSFGTVTTPTGPVLAEVGYCSLPSTPGCATDKSGLVYRSVKPFTRVERHWTKLLFTGANDQSPGGLIPLNPVVDKEYTTLTDAIGNSLLMSAKAFTFDYNGNVIQEIHYDWFDPGLVSRDAVGVPTGIPASATVLRTINYSYYNQASSPSSPNVYAKRSVSTGLPLILNASQQTTLGPSIAQFSYDGQAYGVAPTAGNLTSTSVWDDVDARWITTGSTYDLYGNIATTTDGKGKITQYFFDDTTYALPTRVVVDPQNGTGTQTTTTTYDLSTGLALSVTDPNGAISTINYTNQLLGSIDPFGRPGVMIGPVVNVGGVNQQQRVTKTYEDHLLRVTVATDLNSENDKLLKTRTTTDMLGRIILTEQTEDGTNYTLYSRNAYAEFGRISFRSSIMRTGTSSNTDTWVRVTKDTAGRPTEVTSFGGATQPPNSGTTSSATGTVTTTYAANSTTVADQLGKLKRSNIDALGRLIRVDEPDSNNNLGPTTAPVQATSYTYNVFGNLMSVTQGTQTRNFTYDSLSRLRTASNPESGTVVYTYDDNGNLATRTDARGIQISYEYDALNRNTSVNYSNTTIGTPDVPDITRFYDGATNGKGRFWYSYTSGNLIEGSNAEYSVIDSYDAVGRPLVKRQRSKLNGSWGPIYQIQRFYNLAGGATSQIYPSGNSVSYTYDTAGRTTAFSGNLGEGGSSRIYSTGIIYSPLGGMAKEQFGTNTAVYNKLFYNSRGQLAEIRESTSPYSGPTDTTWNRGAIINHYSDQCPGMCTPTAGMTDNNSNLRKQEIFIPNDDQISSYHLKWQQYDYDALNRLKWVREITNGTEQWRQWFAYDRYGNRTIDNSQDPGDPHTRTYGAGINNLSFEVETATNRLLAPGDSILTGSNLPQRKLRYDVSGNLINDSWSSYGSVTPGQITRTYDAENRMTSALNGTGGTSFYTYDGEGRRTRRKTGVQETWQIYGFEGELLAEYPANGSFTNPQKEYGYRNGQLLVTAEPATTINGYANRRTITIDHNKVPNTDQSNFPVLIKGTYAYLATVSNGGNVQNANGYDVIFTSDPGCTTKLNHEVETYSATTGAVNYWVKVPLVSHTIATNFYICYGNSAITTSQENIAGVWDANFKAIYHLKNGTSLNVTDSTGNHNLTNNGATASTGQVDGGSAFNGTTQYLSIADHSDFRWANLRTVEFWMKLGNTTQTLPRLFSYSNGSADGWSITWLEPASAGPYGLAGNFLVASIGTQAVPSIQKQTPDSGTINSSNAWHHVAVVGNGTTVAAIYINGTLVTTSNYPGNITNTTVSGLNIARRNNNARYFNGSLDEIRFSTAQRSADWIKSGYNNQSSPSTFYTISAAEGTTSASLRWLVADQLGTVRMVIDQTGSLANVKRHDYLPFGEELGVGISGRSSGQGYGGGDGLRQQFNGKERDSETLLDYLGARYYSSPQGRFTSVDPSGRSIRSTNPQTWNRYFYAMNNPLIFIDSNGKWPTPTHDKIVSRAFDTLNDEARKAIQKGSKKVDLDGLNPKTMWESNAAQHAMTPGSYVRALGSFSAAQAAARLDAMNFIQTNLNQASAQYSQAYYSRTGGGLVDAFQTFGSAMHTVMDNWSPMHRDFQLYDGSKMYPAFGPQSLVQFAIEMLEHADGEAREPTEDEMNHMIDEMRLRFYETFGEDAYNRAVSESEREKTADRLSRMTDLRLLLYLRPVERKPKPQEPR